MAKNMLKIGLISLLIMFLSFDAVSQMTRAKIQVSVSALPGVMTAGETRDITVTIRNLTKSTWNSTGLIISTDGAFTIEKASPDITLAPHETGELIYRITAPKIADVYDLSFSLYDNNKRAIERKKIIEVVDNPTIDAKD